MSEKRDAWYLRPRVMLPIVALAIAAAAVFAPQAGGGRSGDARLTSNSRAPQGAALLHDLAARRGFRVERKLGARFPMRVGATYLVLDPRITLRQRDTRDLLAHVRGGGAAFVVLGNGTEGLADSLGVRTDVTVPLMRPTDDSECGSGGGFYSLWMGGAPLLLPVTFKRPPVGRIDTLVEVRSVPRRRRGAANVVVQPALVGYNLGAGRLVVAVDGDVVRNDALRECRLGLDVAAMRALEFLRDGGRETRSTLVFDEYHQGEGENPGTVAAISRFLGRSAEGHVVFQWCAAGLLLLLASAPRPLPPRADERMERRSAHEHVDALARAYEQVRATRTVTLRLVQGLRRRLEKGAFRARRGSSEQEFLDRIANTHPDLTAQVELVKRALETTTEEAALPAIAAAVHQIETALTTAHMSTR